MPDKEPTRKMVVVKFRTDMRVQVEKGRFSTADSDLSTRLEKALAAFPDAQVAPLFTRPATDLESGVGKKGSGVKAPNLRVYYRVDVAAENAETLAAQLRDLPGVEMAYIEPDYDVADKEPNAPLEGMVLTAACPPAPLFCPPGPLLCPPGPIICPPAPFLFTPDLSSNQTYLQPANTGGMDALFIWTKPGGKGANMQFTDTEFGWNVNQEDLNTSAATPTFGNNNSDEHGTKVLGEVVSQHNSWGVNGIAPDAQVALLTSISNQSIADCIDHAAAALSAGDVILIELQTGFKPVEIVEANYDAIVAAVASGVIVVEAAGNGSFDLDTYVRPIAEGGGGNILQRAVRDSGAIMVGSACPPSGNYGPHRSRWQYSNFGSRLDVQGQGREVCTTGGGDLWNGGPNRKYTGDFTNTSAASPQVVGAVLCIQGIRKAKGDPVLTPNVIRSLLVNTGSPQVDGNYGPATQLIGPQPNLRAAYYQLYPVIVCPIPIICIAAPIQKCPPAPIILECKPAPIILGCPPAPDVIKCPPAPMICVAGPEEACAAGPTQGWEDPRDWVDPVFTYRYIEGIGHTLVLLRKRLLQQKGAVGTEPTAAEAAEYGYGQIYWNYNTAAAQSTEEKKPQPPGEFKPIARKRKK